MPGTTPNATAAAAANDVVVDPCLFPAISSATGRGTGIISFAGQIQQEQLKAFSTQRGFNIHDAVASAWTLALREYTGAETAAFAFRDAASSQSRLVQVTTEAGKPISHLVEGLSGTRQHERSHEIAVLPLAEAHFSSINTAVTYNSDNITFSEGLDDAVTSLPKVFGQAHIKSHLSTVTIKKSRIRSLVSLYTDMWLGTDALDSTQSRFGCPNLSFDMTAPYCPTRTQPT